MHFSIGLCVRMCTVSVLGVALAGCATMPASGPETSVISNTEGQPVAGAKVSVVTVTDAVIGKLKAIDPPSNFLETFGDVGPNGNIVGRGDGLSITIWEAPPAVLFGTAMSSPTGGGQAVVANAANVRPTDLPAQIVGTDGKIEVPFAGSVQAAGRTTQDIAQDIVSRLQSKAHDPQVIVRISENSTANITIVGEVANSVRMPLTAKGERLLDALASAGGVKQPVGKMTVQITRGQRVEAMPLQAVIRDFRQNIRLKEDDVVTLLFQPYSFTVLGAAKSNQEIPFEGTGLTLSQALGRMGGLEDQRANPRGVFIFRFEEPGLLRGDHQPEALGADRRTPVIYRVDMRDPKTLFVAQSFPIKDKDVIYISNAPLADFSKFLQVVSQIVYPIAAIENAVVF